MKIAFRGIVIMGLFSTILTLVGCDRVATGELRVERVETEDGVLLACGQPHVLLLES